MKVKLKMVCNVCIICTQQIPPNLTFARPRAINKTNTTNKTHETNKTCVHDKEMA